MSTTCRLPLPENTRPALPARNRIQRWLWQVGVLQRAFPNSTLKLDNVVCTASEHDIHHLLSCTELRDVTICPTIMLGESYRQLWSAIASLGRLHGGRLQLQVAGPDAFRMLKAEPSLAAHVSQAALPWGWIADAGSGLAGQVSSFTCLTKLTLRNRTRCWGKQACWTPCSSCQGCSPCSAWATTCRRCWSIQSPTAGHC